MTEEQQAKKRQLLEHQLDLLLASFDNVQIFASSYDKSDRITSFWQVGDGNVYAREGQVRNWLDSDHKEWNPQEENF